MNLLEGNFNEEAGRKTSRLDLVVSCDLQDSAASFQEALQAWRQGTDQGANLSPEVQVHVSFHRCQSRSTRKASGEGTLQVFQ